MAALKGKTVLITGASRGIGLAIAKTFDREGSRLILVSRNRHSLEQAARQLSSEPLLLPADITRPQDIKRLTALVKKNSRGLDVLINNAGVFTFKPFAKTTLDDWKRNLDTNLTSIFLLTQRLLPLLKRARGEVVNILSVASRVGFANCSAYSASKFGALGLTDVLRRELRTDGIRVTALLPGMTDTTMKNEFGFPIRPEDLLQPEDVAAVVLGAVMQPRRAAMEQVSLMPASGPFSGGN